MSSGHRIVLAPKIDPVIHMIGEHSGLRNFLGRPRIVSRKFLVPFGAGRSMDGGMTYVDEGVPMRFKCGIEPDKYVDAHEGFEWWLMNRLNFTYWNDARLKISAHWWATGYEHYLLTKDGYSDVIEAYEDEWLTYVSEDEAQRISPDTVPPDLYTGAYEAAMDTDAAEEGMDDEILQILLAARARMLVTRQASLVA